MSLPATGRPNLTGAAACPDHRHDITLHDDQQGVITEIIYHTFFTYS